MLRFDKWLPSHWITLLLIVLIIAAGISMRTLQVDMRLEKMMLEEHDTQARYEAFKKEYGEDDFVLIAVSGKDLFEVEGLDAMVETMDMLLEEDTVADVSGIPKVFMDLYNGEDPEALREEITNTPFYTGFFISPDETMAGILVETQNTGTTEGKERFIAGINRAIKPMLEYGYDVDLVGSIIIGEEIRMLSMKESIRFFPVALVVSLIILFMSLRSGRATAVVLLCAMASIILSFGSIVVMGTPLNVVTTSFPLILWMLALANGIHLITRYQFHLGCGISAREAVKHALEEVAFPCFLSAITTSFGFASLCLSRIPPIREFGVIMAVGMLVAFVINMVLGSYLLVLLRTPGPRWVGTGNGELFRRIGTWTLNRPRGVMAVFMALVVFGGYSFTQVRSERNSLSFLPEKSPVVQSFLKIADTLAGSNTMEVLVDTPGGWLNPEYWGPIDALSKKIAKMDHVARVLTPLDMLCKIRQWEEGPGPEEYRLPDSREEAERLVDLASDDEGGGIGRFVADDGEQIRMTVLLRTEDSGDFLQLHDEVQQAFKELPEPLTGHITGSSTLMQHMQVALMESQKKSFALAFLLVFASMLLGLRSIRLLLVSVVPNIMPILSTFSLMVLLDVPLDAGTVMVASIALGIAVDDTVHILASYRRARVRGYANREAILESLGTVGPSITVTSLTASIGFLILGTSVFSPLSYFGLASGVAIIIAWLADLYFVPAILSVFGEKTIDRTP